MTFIHHFIHLYFFTEFEIMFYIYYILPYEKQLVYNLVSRDSILDSLGNKEDDMIITLLDTMKTHNYDDQCGLEEERIDANHDKLWSYCLIYMISMNVLLFLLFLKDLVACYREYNPTFSLASLSSITSFNSIASLSSPVFCNQATKYKKNDFEHDIEIDIEMVDLEKGTVTNSITNNVKNNVTYNSFCVYYWRKSDFVAASWKTTQFMILIGIFEYLFFIAIVNKYKVISAKLLLCKLIQG
jgi:hypothetical protein